MSDEGVKSVILASKSTGRLQMLRAAGVGVEAVAAMVDEQSIKTALIAENAKPRDIADMLAGAKSVKISRKYPGHLVVGSDQILVGPDRQIYDKPQSRDDAIAHLAALSGQSHMLVSAVVICEDGRPIWRFVDSAKMTMRPLGPEFIRNYVETYWDMIQHCVGCYRIEAEGAQLFSAISGNHFTIIGMPLLPVLDYLRIRGNMPS